MCNKNENLYLNPTRTPFEILLQAKIDISVSYTPYSSIDIGEEEANPQQAVE